MEVAHLTRDARGGPTEEVTRQSGRDRGGRSGSPSQQLHVRAGQSLTACALVSSSAKGNGLFGELNELALNQRV